MKKKIVELFAGVGGFRVGFERVSIDWETVWANQWEPKKIKQHAFDCYNFHFGKHGGINEFSNIDINKVDSINIPDHTLLVGGFPCQDYSVASTKTKGIEGKKGVLWWDINRIIKDKNPPFILLENVDRLLKSPSKQRGRDFGIILSCLNNLDYGVEWRVVNAEDYGLQQRRRRVFIFAFKKNTTYFKNFTYNTNLVKNTLFSQALPILDLENIGGDSIDLVDDILTVSNNFSFSFENAGYMLNGHIFTKKVKANTEKIKKNITLGDILEDSVSEEYFLTSDQLKKFTYMKGAKKEERKTSDGFKYIYSEGPIPFPDILERPARTILTSESNNNRSTHIVKDKATGELRKLTPIECERINGFPDNWTNTGMPLKFRYFCMGNALVVDLVSIIAKEITKIIELED